MKTKRFRVQDSPPSRTYWWSDPAVMDKSESDEGTTPPAPPEGRTPNLVSSLLENGLHAPALDIDFPVRLEPSSTPGHFHLFLDGVEMDWPTYKNLLIALADAGVVGKGYARHSIERGQTLCRLPWSRKASQERSTTQDEEPF